MWRELVKTLLAIRFVNRSRPAWGQEDRLYVTLLPSSGRFAGQIQIDGVVFPVERFDFEVSLDGIESGLAETPESLRIPLLDAYLRLFRSGRTGLAIPLRDAFQPPHLDDPGGEVVMEIEGARRTFNADIMGVGDPIDRPICNIWFRSGSEVAIGIGRGKIRRHLCLAD